MKTYKNLDMQHAHVNFVINIEKRKYPLPDMIFKEISFTIAHLKAKFL